MMTEETNRDTLKYSLRVLSILGLYSERRSNRIKIMATIYVILLIFLGFTSMLQFLYVKGDIFEFVNNLEAVGAFFHICGKILVTAYYQGILTLLVKHTNTFWTMNLCNEVAKKRLNYIMTINKRLQIIFFGCIFSSISVLELSPFFGKDLVTGVWRIKGQELLYKIVLSLQLVMFPILCIFLFAFESIFLTLCIKAIIQFKILGEGFKEMNVKRVSSESTQNEFYEDLRACIHYHGFLLRFSSILRKFYSPAVLVEYMTITPLLCTEMYALFESKDFNLLFRHTVVCLTLITDLAVYCIPADYVTSEALEVAHAIYNSNWYIQYFPKLRKPISLVIQRSQQEFVFSAGGFFDINARALLAVLRLSYSACTVVRAVKSN